MTNACREERLGWQAGRTNGFALIEVLISLALMSIILGFMVTALRTVRRSLDTGDRTVTITAVEASLDVVSEMIANTMVRRQQISGSRNPVVFRGDSTTLDFISLSEGDTLGGGPVHVRLSNDQHSIKKRSRLTASFDPLSNPRRELSVDQQPSTVSFEVVQAASFRYFGRRREGDVADWSATWEDADLLPILIEVTFYPVEPLSKRSTVIHLHQSG